MPVRAFVSVGSNLAPERHVPSALEAMAARFGPLAASTVYRCPAEGFEGPDFHNLAVAFDTDEQPEAVVAALRAIEDAHGRRREGARFASRTLDLDLVLYGEAVVDRPGLRLPRDEVLRYAFVLRPLAELAPALRHPVAGRTLGELWAEMAPQAPRMEPLGPALGAQSRRHP